LAPSKCLLLGCLLILTIASSWPAGTSAAPRRARGRHLIWHKRSVDIVPPKEIVEVKIEQKEREKIQCDHKKTMDRSKLAAAHQTARDTRDVLVCLTNQWLDSTDNISMANAICKYSLHKLMLGHPLEEKVKEVQFVDEEDGSFVYAGAVDEADVELPKIIKSLKVLAYMMKMVKLETSVTEFTFKYIAEMIEHNISKAMEVAHLEDCATPEYTYNKEHAFKEYAVYMEGIHLLTVVERAYAQ
ncbi:hypothetical protein KR009_003797, partial [Drosophila setifemur]